MRSPMLTTYAVSYANPWAADVEKIEGPSREDSPDNFSIRAAEVQVQNDEDLAWQLQEEEVHMFCQEEHDKAAVTPDLTSDPSRDAMLASSLSSLKSVQVQPRVNPSSLPSGSVSNKDRSRLLLRLDQYGLVERGVKGDGNCQFRAISDQLYRSPNYHREVRNAVVAQLRRHRTQYCEYVPGNYEQYCSRMLKDGTWGDHVTLQASADHFGLSIRILTSFLESSLISVEPRSNSHSTSNQQQQSSAGASPSSPQQSPLGRITPSGGKKSRSERVLWLSFWAEVHYNSLYPASEPPPAVPVDKFLGSKRLGALVHEGIWPGH